MENRTAPMITSMRKPAGCRDVIRSVTTKATINIPQTKIRVTRVGDNFVNQNPVNNRTEKITPVCKQTVAPIGR